MKSPVTDIDTSLAKYQEIETGEAFTLQGPRLLKVELAEASVMAKNGAMVAYSESEAERLVMGGGHSRDLIASRHSHSIVPGGFEVRSRVTRLTPGTSLMIRLETRSSRS